MRYWILLLAFVSVQSFAQSPRQVEHSFHSSILNGDRKLLIRLPARYADHQRRFPVVFIFDAQDEDEFMLFSANTQYYAAMDIHDPVAPEVITVGIAHADRNQDLLLNAPNFTKFLTQELIPYLDSAYRTAPYHVLIGHSLGGAFVTRAMIAQPKAFQAAIAVSPFFQESIWEKQIKPGLDSVVSRGDWTNHGYVFSSGSYPHDNIEATLRGATLKMDEFLRGRMRYKFVDLPGKSHIKSINFTMPAAIDFLFGGDVWQMPMAERDSILALKGNKWTRIQRNYQQISQRVGYSVSPEYRWIGIAYDDFIRKKEFELAVSLMQEAERLYPEKLDTYLKLAQAYKQAEQAAEGRATLIRARQRIKLTEAGKKLIDTAERSLTAASK